MAIPETQDRTADRWALRAGWWLLFACLLFLSRPLPAQGLDAVVLEAAAAPIQLIDPLAWFGATADADITSATRGTLRFVRRASAERLPFNDRRALWIKLRLQVAAGDTNTWLMQVPVTIVDRVTLYQQNAAGQWVGRSAGDKVAAREWPYPGRYPTFPLHLRAQEPTDVFLEVRHSADLSVPVFAVTSVAQAGRTQLEYLALGVLMGVLGLLLVSSSVRAVLVRDGAHAWYAGFTALAMLSIAAFTGVAGQFLWSRAPSWTDAAPGCLTLLASAVSAWLFARIAGLVGRRSWVGGLLRMLTWSGAVLSVGYLMVNRQYGVWMLGLQPLLVAIAGLYASVLTLRRDDRVGVWMLLGALPLCVSVMIALVRVTGILAPSWWSEYLLVLALTMNIPMLLVALNSRTEERRAVELRRQASASLDPLTALMRRPRFLSRLHQAVLRQQNFGESAGIALVELKNFEWIRSAAGEEAAEEALLRVVIHLRRVLRDVDTAARLGENTFGLIVEGAGRRDDITQIASRLIAGGLMQDPQQPHEPELQLHIAALMLNEHAGPADVLLRELHAVLTNMPARTRRPLRFHEPGSRDEAGVSLR